MIVCLVSLWLLVSVCPFCLSLSYSLLLCFKTVSHSVCFPLPDSFWSLPTILFQNIPSWGLKIFSLHAETTALFLCTFRSRSIILWRSCIEHDDCYITSSPPPSPHPTFFYFIKIFSSLSLVPTPAAVVTVPFLLPFFTCCPYCCDHLQINRVWAFFTCHVSFHSHKTVVCDVALSWLEMGCSQVSVQVWEWIQVHSTLVGMRWATRLLGQLGRTSTLWYELFE